LAQALVPPPGRVARHCHWMGASRLVSVGPGGSACRGLFCKRPACRLGTFKDVPEIQRRPYILDYYRLERPKLRHLWCCHNELGNIWTHLLAWVYMFMRFVSWVSLQGDPSALEPDRRLYLSGIVAYFVASLVVFGISVQYHWRLCSSMREVRCWLCLDQSACLGILMVGYFAGIPMGFHCYPVLRLAYLGLSVVVSLSTALLLAFLGPDRSTAKASIIIGAGMIALIPAVHWLIISTEGRRAAGRMLMASIVCALAASYVYKEYVPECFAPGRFDLLGSSHQVWHVLIFFVVAAYSDCLIAVFALTGGPAYCG